MGLETVDRREMLLSGKLGLEEIEEAVAMVIR
jgi:hypothetical protein